MYKYNDNELLYLIYENNEIALGILFEKYKNLIRKRLATFKIQKKNYDDFFQEGLMMLHLAIIIYNPYSKKTFNKFFDLILQRRIMNILRAEKHYFYQVTINDELMMLQEDSKYKTVDSVYDDVNYAGLKKIDQEIFKLKYLNNYSVEKIAQILGVDVKYVYNHAYLIKKKILKNKQEKFSQDND